MRRDGLVTSVRELARRFSATTGVSVTVDIAGTVLALSPDREDALFRVVHEALSNVERHADAASVSVALAYEPDEVRVVVEDDGVGIGGGGTTVADAPRFGLRAIQRRVRAAVRDRRPHGTLIEASLPLDPGPAEITPAPEV